MFHLKSPADVLKHLHEMSTTPAYASFERPSALLSWLATPKNIALPPQPSKAAIEARVLIVDAARTLGLAHLREQNGDLDEVEGDEPVPSLAEAWTRLITVGRQLQQVQSHPTKDFPLLEANFVVPSHVPSLSSALAKQPSRGASVAPPGATAPRKRAHPDVASAAPPAKKRRAAPAPAPSAATVTIKYGQLEDMITALTTKVDRLTAVLQCNTEITARQTRDVQQLQRVTTILLAFTMRAPSAYALMNEALAWVSAAAETARPVSASDLAKAHALLKDMYSHRVLGNEN
jgi:hypothetical protein